MNTSDFASQECSFTAPTQPFRFLDLPKELRLMVYERLPREIKHYTIKVSKPPSACCLHNASMILVKKATSTDILAACKQINSEADGLVQKTIRNFILTATPKIVMNAEACHDCCASDQTAGLECLIDTVQNLSKAVRTAGSERNDWYSPTREQLNNLCITDSHMQSKFNNICIQTERQLAFHGNSHIVQLVNILPKSSSPSYQMLFQENRLRPLFHMNMHLPQYAGFEVTMAGWIKADPSTGNLILDKCIPTYMQSRYPASARYHYNICDGAIVDQAMDKDTWTQEWLE